MKNVNPKTHITIWCLAAIMVFCMPLMASAASDNGAVRINLIEDKSTSTVLDYTFGSFSEEKVRINGQAFKQIKIGKESVMKEEVGAPELPQVNRSIIIPNDAYMKARVVTSEYYEMKNVDIAPSRGFIYRNVNPDTVPYMFGSQYKKDAFYPAKPFDMGKPYIMRDYRGVVVKVYPFQYNPVKRVLRVYTSIRIEVGKAGSGKVNVKTRPFRPHDMSRAFDKIYNNHFLNYENRMAELGHGSKSKYSPMGETGDMLIICYDSWMANVQPLVQHKTTTMGITTRAVAVSTIGNNSTSIKNYIQNQYDTGNLAFVLLVGDSSEVATPSASGGASDPSYAKLSGSDDYPDILIGRFSAQSSAHVDTQVERTIEYEQNGATQAAWFKKGVGIASNEGPGHDNQYDYQHIDAIRTDLLGYGYTTVDQVYDPGASASTVTNALNAGRGVINYTGHGSTTAWVSSGFDTGDVNALTNDNMLPFIFDVACVNGEFDGPTCFAETWMRATHNGEPTGAIGIYASSINQSWSPPMDAQDEMNDLLVAETYVSYGAICFAGSCKMMDLNGSGGVEMYNTWHIFGDPSLRVFGTAAPPTGLSVTSGNLNAAGDAGGPFTPGSITYTLENLGSSTINFSVSKSQTWVSLSTTSGSLYAGQTKTVTVSINAAANTLGNGTYTDTVQFTNTTNHEGDTGRSVTLTIGVPSTKYFWDMNTNPGWSTQGLWAWGTPNGTGGDHGNPAPTSGHSGSNVYAYNLTGGYENSLAETHLTTGAIDCSELSDVTVKFYRWLGVEQPSYDHAYLRVSTNGSTWTDVWANTGALDESSWSQQEYDISDVADGQSTVYLRWTMGTTDGTWTFAGWYIDDVEIVALGDGGGTEPDCYNAGDCADGFFCNGVEQCIDGTCVAGSDPCPGQTCDEGQNMCLSLPEIDSPPEYADMDGMLISWGSYNDVLTDMTVAVTTGDPDAIVYIAVDGSSTQSSATSTLTSAGADMSQVEFMTYNTDTVWVRDYGPRFVNENSAWSIIDFDYNRPRPNDDAFPPFVGTEWNEAVDASSLSHGDGNFHVMGTEAFMSDLILDENPSYTEASLKTEILNTQGLNLTLYPKFPSSFDATGHIDMWMIPASDNKVIVGEYSSSTGTPYTITENAAADLASRGYTVYRTPGWNSGGTHYTYTNAVVMNDVVMVPSYGSSNDSIAQSVFQQAFPGRTIHMIDCSGIISAAGAMHCIVKHVPAGAGGDGGGSGGAGTLEVTVDITHTYIGDLSVVLTTPSSQTVTLHNREGGSADDIHVTYSVDDWDGNWQGTWQLYVADHVGQDTGTLDNWSISATPEGGSTHNATAQDTPIAIPDANPDGGINSYIYM